MNRPSIFRKDRCIKQAGHSCVLSTSGINRTGFESRTNAQEYLHRLHGYNMQSFDQKHRVVASREPAMHYDSFKNADMAYFRALSQYLDHHITLI